MAQGLMEVAQGGDGEGRGIDEAEQYANTHEIYEQLRQVVDAVPEHDADEPPVSTAGDRTLYIDPEYASGDHHAGRSRYNRLPTSHMGGLAVEAAAMTDRRRRAARRIGRSVQIMPGGGYGPHKR